MSRNFLYFLQILFFWVGSSVIRQKNGTKCQKNCPRTLSYGVICGTQLQNDNISRFFFHFVFLFFQNFDFSVC